MRRNLLGMLEGATVKHIRGDAGRTESMAAGRVGQAGSFRASLDHVQNITPRDRIFSQLVAFFEAPEQRALLVLTDAGGRDPVIQIVVETVVAGDLVPFAAFFVPRQPRAAPPLGAVLDA